MGAFSRNIPAGLYDNGGILRPGWNLAYNGTGAREHLVPAAPAAPVVLEVRANDQQTSQLLANLLRKAIRAKGGNVQTALGTR
jgi:hypothetical protein